MNTSIFTIGHSVHEMETFIHLLKHHDVTAVCDVRSTPYSRFNSQYNREDLKVQLLKNGIKYVFLGKELGARSNDPKCYEDGRVQYDRLAKTDLFKKGLERIYTGAKDNRIALMCAEKEPLECHRTILVSRELEKKGFSISHILHNGELEMHPNTINRLLHKLNLANGDLFMTETDVYDQAYKTQGNLIGYTMRDEDNQSVQEKGLTE